MPDNNQIGEQTVNLSLSDNSQIGEETISDIDQLDGAFSVCSSLPDNNQSGDDQSESDNQSQSDDQSESDVSIVSWDDEAFSAPIRAVLVPAPAPPGAPPGAPPDLTVDTTGQARAPSCLPLAIVTNARSLKMKQDNLRTMLRQISPDFANICETFEASRFVLEKSLNMEHYKVISYRRPSPRVGGGTAIIYTEQNFTVEEANICVEKGVEACWAIFTPRNTEYSNIKRKCVGSIYIAPLSKYKQESVDHIIDVMFQIKTRYGNEVNFFISGDFNKYPVANILSANGALKHVVSVATRKSAVLEVILTDLATLYHPPTSRPPLQVDEGKTGSNSDHNIIIYAPKSNLQFKKERQFTSIKHRPLPPSKIQVFGQAIVNHPWMEVLECEDVNQKARNFHHTITKFRDQYFPQKLVRMSSLDKPWMHPDLKSIYFQMTNEYLTNRRSDKWKRLYKKFRRGKRAAIRGANYEAFADQVI